MHSAGVPQASRDLIWDVFFKSRHRGVSLEVHFPWINDKNITHCLSVDVDVLSGQKTSLASLVLKAIQSATGEWFGLVGLVCVSPQSRRKGLSAKLVSSAIAVGHTLGWKGLILWTRSPEIYASQGFTIEKQELFGSVEGIQTVSFGRSITSQSWPNVKDSALLRGMPPFASAASHYARDGASVIALQTPLGLTVADWEGPTTSVVNILAETMPSRWFLNVQTGDAIVGALSAQNFRCDLAPANCQMVKSLCGAIRPEWPKISFLDRI